MHNKPLVSIVVVTYNSASTIIESLESFKAQTYSNLELIISDDCSKDDTVSKCKLWIEKNNSAFAKVVLVESDVNTGVSANLNRGINHANGLWIKTIAGDDLLIPTAIEEFVSFADNHPEDVRMCVSDVAPFSVDGDVPQNIKDAYQRYFELESEPFAQQRKRVMTKLVFVGPAYFFRRDLYDEVGGFNEKYGNSEEWPFVYKIITNGNRIYAINKKLVCYRVSLNSLCNSREELGLVNKRLFMGMYRHFFDCPFKDLIKGGRVLLAWHYALSFWSRRFQYHFRSVRMRKVVSSMFFLLSPLVYMKKLGLNLE